MSIFTKDQLTKFTKEDYARHIYSVTKRSLAVYGIMPSRASIVILNVPNTLRYKAIHDVLKLPYVEDDKYFASGFALATIETLSAYDSVVCDNPFELALDAIKNNEKLKSNAMTRNLSYVYGPLYIIDYVGNDKFEYIKIDDYEEALKELSKVHEENHQQEHDNAYYENVIDDIRTWPRKEKDKLLDYLTDDK